MLAQLNTIQQTLCTKVFDMKSKVFGTCTLPLMIVSVIDKVSNGQVSEVKMLWWIHKLQFNISYSSQWSVSHLDPSVWWSYILVQLVMPCAVHKAGVADTCSPGQIYNLSLLWQETTEGQCLFCWSNVFMFNMPSQLAPHWAACLSYKGCLLQVEFESVKIDCKAHYNFTYC